VCVRVLVRVAAATVVWAEHLDGWTAWAEVKGSEYIVSGGEAGGADGDDGDDDGDGSTACTSLYYEGCDDEVGLADLAELVEVSTHGRPAHLTDRRPPPT
jgi:hypothetical protein